ncbi:uncharacterized protein N7483_010903 [Penicillium malachiteum]|uniref:uncharacterized protein n=1 Tax=Penicillium malachiteum TaxID=1324776 RepID=UPI0025472AE3|nr:uncharacterized protein N7483_010903 [Penicillium malachiteum]KAJ5713722.1 hypothetical protein N7483_010903 [Penicillium malachiteum]
MDKETDQKNSQRLARVRENQRKSRARKQEYVRELEQRIGACNEEAQQKDIENRLKIQKIEAENRHLRTLLRSLGVSSDLVQRYVQLASEGAAVDRKVAIPAISRSKDINDSESTSQKATKSESSLTPEPLKTPASEAQEDPSPPHENITNPSLCGCSTEEQIANSWPSDDNLLNTTLCSIADDLVRQYNARGTDIDEIRHRLWAGFRRGQSGDGCRVQNNILFQVLDEISNGI